MPFSPLDALMQVGAPKRAAESSARHDGTGAFKPALEEAYRAETPRPPVEPPPRKQETEAARTTASEQRDADDHSEQPAASAENAVAAKEDADRESEESADAIAISEEANAAASAAAAPVEPTVVKAAVASEGEEGAVAVTAAKNATAGDEESKSQSTAGEAGDDEAVLDATAASGEEELSDEAAPKMSPLHSTRQLEAAATSKATDPDANGQAEETPTEALTESELAAKSDVELQAEAAAGKASELSAESREQRHDSNGEGNPEEPQATPARATASPAMETTVAPVELATTVESAEVDATTASPASTPVETSSNIDAAPRSQRALDRLIAGHSSRQAKEAAETPGMPTVDHARFVNRVEGAMRAAHQGDGRINVRLSPPDLGSVKIELALQNGVLSAKLEAETPAARNLLLDSLPALRDRLAQQDIQIEKFDVDVRQEGNGQQGGGESDDRAADHSGERSNGRPRPGAPQPPVKAPTARARAAAASSAGLDVRV